MRRKDFRALRGVPAVVLAVCLAVAGGAGGVAADSTAMSLATETWTSPSDTLAEDHTRSTPANTSADVTPWALETRRERAHERPLSPRGWSTWSDWSTCSRSCDGGASYQLRRCKSTKGCRGEAMRYKICNMQPCQDAVDFRAQQCEAWNREERHNRFYRWTPYHDEQRPCSLVCRGEPVPDGVPDGAPRTRGKGRRRRARKRRGRRDHRKEDGDDNGDDEEEEEDDDEDEDHVDVGSGPIVEVLAPKAQDGTRCRPGSLDMCINGKCQHVGCDLRIGSRKTVDACGVCGGDGSSCATPLYHWDTVPSSLCSEACGGGYRSASHVCKNRVTGLEVEDALCDQTRRPEGEVEPCNTHRCPAKWIAEAWEMCSVSCGGGVRHRDVYCAEVISGNLTKVSDDMCYGTAKPRHKEPCASEKCPTWDSGEWSECSASCGMGIQTRPLACVDSYGSSLDDTACDPLRQPPLTRTCAAPSPCPQHAYNSLLPTSESGEDDQDSFDPDLDSDTDSDYTDPLLRPYPPMPAIAERLVGGANTDRAFLPGPWSPCSATCGEGWQHREVHCRVYLEGTKARARIDDRECPGPKPPDKQTCSGPPCISTMTKRFVVGEWGPCSVTCGEGVQHREVYCRLFLELSRGTTTLKQDQCPGMKPPESRSCTVSLCPLANTLDSRQDHPMADTAESPRIGGRKGTFSWKELGFGECSKSCLGGVQESIIQCVRDDDGKPAAPYQCRHEPKPEQRTRTCNDQPCPPRWNVTDWSTCSDECGMGIKIRDVTCLHEVTNTNLVPVPNNRCPAPPPPDRSYCNVLDCQPAWNASEWSKCSRPCGGGTKTRHVTCTQRMAQNHVVSRPASMCPAHAKPVERKPCNPKACSPDDVRPRIEANDELHVTDSKPTQKQMSVKIGGSVHIFLGTRLKIRCPVKRFNRSRIVWQKDGKVLHPSRKYHISNKGVLKVVDASMHDGGRYSCVAGHSSADLTVVVKNIPGKFPNSEEVGGGQTPQQDPTYRDRHADTGRVFPGAGDDISHEVPPTGTSRFDTRRKQTPSPDKKYSYPRPDGNSVQGNNVYNNYNGHVSRPPYRNEYPSTPDDEDDEDDDGDPEDGSTAYPDATASSSATRSAPPLHGLVRHFQSVVAFSFIRQVLSDRLSTLPPLLSRLDQRPAPADSPPAADAAVAADQDAATTTEAAVGAGVLLGKGSAAAAELKFEWVITPWSDCSETCGGNGFQLRGAQCTVRRSGNATRGAAGTPGPATESVDAALCDDAGLPPPSTFQRCGSDECPRWSAGEWSTCEDSRCFAWNTAMQRRDVECKLPNDTLVDPLLCDEAEKPPVRLECYNDRCKGTWRVVRGSLRRPGGETPHPTVCVVRHQEGGRERVQRATQARGHEVVQGTSLRPRRRVSRRISVLRNSSRHEPVQAAALSNSVLPVVQIQPWLNPTQTSTQVY